MEWILCAIGCIALMTLLIFIIIYIELKPSKATYNSKYILDKFKPTDASPTLTEMIEFHKSNKIHKK